MERQQQAALWSADCPQGGSSHPALSPASSPGSETTLASVSHSMVYGSVFQTVVQDPMGHDLQFLFYF